MEELTNLVAQAQHSPAWNVYLCWFLICLMFMNIFFQSILFKSFSEETKKSYEELKLVENGKFTLKWILNPVWGSIMITLANDILVYAIGGTSIDIYNRMWWAQFLDASTIFNLLP
tara:strand:- start:1306 stop:1653 length:348 start_codon:yes stop_codon:yes gene_type:complete